MSEGKNVIEVKNLRAVVHEEGQDITLLHDSSFVVREGECLGILDEHFTVTGEVFFEGKDLLKESGESLRLLRGSKLAMVMQNPMTSFDPLIRIEEQVVETFVEHTDWSRTEILQRALELFEKLQIRDPAEALKKYPHQLSGGMLQRIMIGIALMLEPRLLIACRSELILFDEAVSSLDAHTQVQIMDLLLDLKEKLGLTYIFITHDLTSITYFCSRVIFLKDGSVVADSPVSELSKLDVPYAKELLGAVLDFKEALINSATPS